MYRGYPFRNDEGSIRVNLASALCIVVLVGAVFFVVLPSVEESLMERKKETIRELVESAWSLLNWYQGEVEAGRLDPKEARARAADQIRHLSYGPNEDDYIWINSLDARMIMHPYRKDLESIDLREFRDAGGKQLFVELLRVVTEKGEGYVDYLWPRKDDPQSVSAKISFVKLFTPWEWVLGTGILIDDVESEIAGIKRRFAILALGTLSFVALFACYVILQNMHVERERRTAESALRESEEKYSKLMETAYDAIFIADAATGVILEANPRAGELLGISPEEIVGMHETELHPPEEADRYRKIFEEDVKRGKGMLGGSPIQEFYLYRKDGRLIPVEATSSVMTLGGRHVIQRIFRDVTERKDNEMALRAISEKRAELARIVNQSPAVPILWRADEGWPVVFVTDNIRQFGYSAKDLIDEGFRYFQIIHPDDLTRISNEIEAYSSLTDCEKFEQEYRILTKDGEVRWLDGRTWIRRDEKGDITHYQGIILDITPRKQAELALKSERDKAQKYLDIAGVIFVVLDAKERILVLNTTGCEVLGYKEGEVLGRNWFDIAIPERMRDEVRGIFKSLMRGEIESVASYENPVTTKTGEERIIAWHNTVLRDEEGSIVGTLSSGEDITERKFAEEKLLEYQSHLRSLASELSRAEERERRRIATMLHDSISQSLVALKVKLEFLRESMESAHEKESLDPILEGLDGVIEETRSMTFELCPPILYDLGLEAGLEWLAEQFQAQQGIMVQFKDDLMPKPLEDDVRVILFQAARELLMNIAKHAQARAVELNVERNGSEIRINVRDDGVGFNPSVIDVRWSESTGFGLFSIRERLKHIGGRIFINTAEGEGTSITLAASLKVSESEEKERV